MGCVAGGDNKRIGGTSDYKLPELTYFDVSLGEYFINKIDFPRKFNDFLGYFYIVIQGFKLSKLPRLHEQGTRVRLVRKEGEGPGWPTRLGAGSGPS